MFVLVVFHATSNTDIKQRPDIKVLQHRFVLHSLTLFSFNNIHFHNYGQTSAINPQNTLHLYLYLLPTQ